MDPKVFISYSWKSSEFQKEIVSWADRLLHDGIEVVMDVYDLKEGDDKFVFMEQMVNDESVTHVLVICDSTYTQKANKRESGVGTESQIISKNVYEKVKQSKFIPIITDYNENGKPYLPTFMETRIWIDFSSVEKVNLNWEQLVRLIYDKPLMVKPKKGNKPQYIDQTEKKVTTLTYSKLRTLKSSIENNRFGIEGYRSDFFKEIYHTIDSFRTRDRSAEISGQQILENLIQLKEIRNNLIDWLMFEGKYTKEDSFSELLIDLLENLVELRSRPRELNPWSEEMLETQRIFVYEVFVYIISGLLKLKKYSLIHEVLTTHYLQSESDRRRSERDFVDFYIFQGSFQSLQILAPEGQRLESPVGEYIKQHCDRVDIKLSNLIESDLIIYLMSLIKESGMWYPQMTYYQPYNEKVEFFIRCIQKKNFKNLSVITGISDVEELRERVKKTVDEIGDTHRFGSPFGGFPELLFNLEKLNTLD
ncbi:TIR domain-containing protein [Candidatus Haliotispira prima]|uniref:TIR domain-containing protein n=1 Tax=Candidatus Haliotispira prima TaxID=3034016 RepID=A0ABY8MIF5_9SPIO|nr:TIR domain-containing protein [Candidatus Haliotispira prima]